MRAHGKGAAECRSSGGHGRSKSSIEFKHKNFSAVLVQLRMPWTRGYKFIANFQKALLDGSERYLDAKDREAIDLSRCYHLKACGMRCNFLWTSPPLTSSKDVFPDIVRRLVRKVYPAARDARNRQLGRLGEEAILKNKIDGFVMPDAMIWQNV